jgi:hypothetical protein
MTGTQKFFCNQRISASSISMHLLQVAARRYNVDFRRWFSACQKAQIKSKIVKEASGAASVLEQPMRFTLMSLKFFCDALALLTY